MLSRPTLQLLAAIAVLTVNSAAQQPALDKANQSLLWTEPDDIRSRNLYWGVGGEKHQPVPPLEFLGEDLKGTNPQVRRSGFKRKEVAIETWR